MKTVEFPIHLKCQYIQGSQSSLVPRLQNFFSCSTQVSMKFFLLTNVKMPTIVGILTFISRKNSILGLPEPKKSCIS